VSDSISVLLMCSGARCSPSNALMARRAAEHGALIATLTNGPGGLVAGVTAAIVQIAAAPGGSGANAALVHTGDERVGAGSAPAS